MDHKINRKLKKLFKEIHQDEDDNSKIAVPFVPYIGCSYCKASKKVLVVGKATDGWGWKDSKEDEDATLEKVKVDQPEWFEELKKIAPKFIEEKIIRFYSGNKGYSSLLWNRTYRILSKLLEDQPLCAYSRDPKIAGKAFRSFAWTNVFKVTHTRGNPKKKLRERQTECNTLKDEIEYLQPDAILFFTSPSYDKHLKEVLPGIHIEGVPIAKISGLDSYGFEGIALRTYHPQYYKFNMHDVVDKLT